ncbi:hypothetical protein ACFV9C_38140 [Kribbella sp. NPDC059898]|uniref:hypothetical protein n=1 Tax=Kribbella sp. NPDC059898 TaxID=3346995 RepID=UPI003666E219
MAPQHESATGVLDHLDAQVPTSFYWSLTLLATVGGFLFGYDTANIGSVVNFLPWNLGSLALGYLVAGASSAPPSARSPPVRLRTGSAASRC